jgi:hypothetical protein
MFVGRFPSATEPFGTHRFIFYFVLVVGMSMGMVGFDELNRGGHLIARRNLFICLIILFFLPLIHMHWRMTGWNFTDIYLFIPSYALIVASFPIALYLNRRQNKSDSDPNNTDAE